MKNILNVLITFLILTGCSVQSRQEQSSIRELIVNKKFDDALNLLEKSSLKSDKKNRLLYLMEKGRILFSKEDFYNASLVFLEANKLVDRLYTKNVREKILSTVGNDNSETYYGSVFERSMLYYYQALSFFKLYQLGQYETEKKISVKKDGKTDQVKKTITVKLKNNERRKFLLRARASIVAWNSFFSDLQRSNTETLYRNDLLGKLFAANIHEVVGFKDRQITLQLYKDARFFLTTQGHTYKHFDKNYKELTRNLQDMLGKSRLSLNGSKPQVTNYYQELLDFLDYKILALTWNIRRNEYSRLVKQYKPSKEVIEKLKQNKRIGNVAIFLERKVITPMKPETFEYSLNAALKNIEDPTSRALIEGIGIPIITYFAMGPLGLSTVTKTGNTVIYTSHDIGTTMVKHTGIEFEMPIVKSSPLTNNLELHVYKKENENEVFFTKSNFVVSSPNNDIAEQAASERAGASYVKVGVRVAVKHAIAILAAYQTYSTMRGSNGENEFVAKAVAFAQYMASAKGIAATEKADTRHWTSLPAVVNLADLYLPKGNYRIAVKSVGKSNLPERNLGTISVGDSKQKKIFTYQL